MFANPIAVDTVDAVFSDEFLFSELFKYLSVNDLYNCACVSRPWREIAARDVIWTAHLQRRLGVRDPLYADLTLSGGQSLHHMFWASRLCWPSRLVGKFLESQQLHALETEGSSVTSTAGEGALPQTACRAAGVLSVQFKGSAGGDRAVVGNHAFPAVYRGRGTSESAHKTIPFVWAPAARPAPAAGSSTSSSAAAFRTKDAPVRLAGAYMVAYFEVEVGSHLTPSPPAATRASLGGQAAGGAAAKPAVVKPWGSRAIAIGIATRRFPLSGKMPGWDRHSYGYHSDDGYRFHASGMGTRHGPQWKEGDTVGCGLVYAGVNNHAPSLMPPTVQLDMSDRGVSGGRADSDEEREGPCAEAVAWMRLSAEQAAAAWPSYTNQQGATLFFTCNGRMLGPAFSAIDVSTKRWYPTLGIDSPFPVTFNFGGKPFAFDVRKFNAGLWLRTATPHVSLPRPVAVAMRGGSGVQLGASGITIAPRPPIGLTVGTGRGSGPTHETHDLQGAGTAEGQHGSGRGADSAQARASIYNEVSLAAATVSTASPILVPGASPASSPTLRTGTATPVSTPSDRAHGRSFLDYLREHTHMFDAHTESRVQQNVLDALRNARMDRIRLKYRPPPSPPAATHARLGAAAAPSTAAESAAAEQGMLHSPPPPIASPLALDEGADVPSTGLTPTVTRTTLNEQDIPVPPAHPERAPLPASVAAEEDASSDDEEGVGSWQLRRTRPRGAAGAGEAQPGAGGGGGGVGGGGGGGGPMAGRSSRLLQRFDNMLANLAEGLAPGRSLAGVGGRLGEDLLRLLADDARELAADADADAGARQRRLVLGANDDDDDEDEGSDADAEEEDESSDDDEDWEEDEYEEGLHEGAEEGAAVARGRQPSRPPRAGQAGFMSDSSFSEDEDDETGLSRHTRQSELDLNTPSAHNTRLRATARAGAVGAGAERAGGRGGAGIRTRMEAEGSSMNSSDAEEDEGGINLAVYLATRDALIAEEQQEQEQVRALRGAMSARGRGAGTGAGAAAGAGAGHGQVLGSGVLYASADSDGMHGVDGSRSSTALLLGTMRSARRQALLGFAQGPHGAGVLRVDSSSEVMTSDEESDVPHTGRLMPRGSPPFPASAAASARLLAAAVAMEPPGWPSPHQGPSPHMIRTSGTDVGEPDDISGAIYR